VTAGGADGSDDAGEAAQEGAAAAPRRKAGRPRASDRPAVSRDRQIIEAAIRVFASKGFHAARVADIAREADVAYGLVYHYFPTKDALLERIFHRTWGHLVQGLRAIIEEPGASAADKVSAVVRLMLGSYQLLPDVVRVLILEVTRSDHLRARTEEIAEAFDLLERLVADGQASGEFRSGIDPRFASFVLWGAIDEVLTGWVYEVLPYGDDALATAEAAVTGMVLGGLVAPASAES
jgi:AcrR family transcriptional regulator